jgi:hypothetical protein
MGRPREHRAPGQVAARRLLVVLAALLVVVLAIWLLSDDDDSSSQAVAPEAVTAADLGDFSSSSTAPIFWAGEQEGATMELSTNEGGTYVRYLTDGAEPGDPRAEFLTVGSYAFADPIPALEKLSEQPNGVERSVPGGGVAYFNRTDPQNVYLAYPGLDVQIEVYDPDPVRAKEIVTSGQIVPVN